MNKFSLTDKVEREDKYASKENNRRGNCYNDG